MALFKPPSRRRRLFYRAWDGLGSIVGDFYHHPIRAIMRTLIIIAVILFGIIYYKEISNFVTGNAPSLNQAITKWFVDHTPKK